MDDTYAQAAIDMVRVWMADGDRGMLQMKLDTAGSLELLDTRGERANAPRRAVLQGWKAAIFLACDRAQPFATLAALPEVKAEGVGAEDLRAFLGRCVENDLMVTSGQVWLNVAVHVPAREDADGANRAARRLREIAMAGEG